MTTSLSPSLQAVERVETGALSAPLFQQLIERLGNGDRWVVLDLGAARARTVELLNQFRCRLEIAGLGPELEALNAETDPKRVREQIESLLPVRRKEAVDMVLCWDLLNYLNRVALSALMECIALRGRPDALAHALVVYAAKRMPAVPAGYVPLEDHRLLATASRAGERDAPRYTPDELARLMPDYAVERGRLLRNGMQEFLFRLQPWAGRSARSR